MRRVLNAWFRGKCQSNKPLCLCEFERADNQSVFEYAPRSDGAEDYTAVAREVLKWLGS